MTSVYADVVVDWATWMTSPSSVSPCCFHDLEASNCVSVHWQTTDWRGSAVITSALVVWGAWCLTTLVISVTTHWPRSLTIVRVLSVSLCRTVHVSPTLQSGQMILLWMHAAHGRTQDFSRCGQIHRRIQDFLWGALFSSKKLTTFFSRRPQNTGQNY